MAQSDDIVLSHFDLDAAMQTVMSSDDIERLNQYVDSHGASTTLWDTMVDVFGEKTGNIYTNHLMDQRWRVDNGDGGSLLFEQAWAHDLPVSSDDAQW